MQAPVPSLRTLFNDPRDIFAFIFEVTVIAATTATMAVIKQYGTGCSHDSKGFSSILLLTDRLLR